MNPIILTKTAKFTLIGSLSALLSFIAKFHPQVRQFGIYVYGAVVFCFLLAALWEGRKAIENQSSIETDLAGIIPTFTSANPKREYLLPPAVRLELIVGLVIATACLLVGSI